MELDALLNEDQLTAARTLDGPVLVLAGAGSGKTRVVTYRIVNLIEHGVDPASIVGLTFTNKAAEEMKSRVQSLTSCRVLICTFHSFGVRILRESVDALGYSRDFVIYDASDAEKLLKSCLEELGIKETSSVFKQILQLISSAKNAMQASSDVDVREYPYAIRDLFPKAYALYQAKLRSYNALDFDDLLYLTVRLFREHDAVLQRYRDRYKYMLIDEYQDTNEAQYSIVRMLMQHQPNLCVVGDPDQSIYSWRGANMSNILRFEEDYPGAVVVRLDQNYRSRANILDAANHLIAYNNNRYDKHLWSDLGAGEKVKHFFGDDAFSEARFIADRMRYHHANQRVPLTEMVIFYRTNAQSRVFEDIFLQEHIPYVIVGGLSFYQRREIKDILAFLRVVYSGSDFISFARTLNVPKRGIGDTTLEKLSLAATAQNLAIFDYCQKLIAGEDDSVKLSKKQRDGLADYVSLIRSLREIARTASLKALVTAAMEMSGYLEFIKADGETYEDRKENLDALITKALEWELVNPAATLKEFLEELSLKASLDEADMNVDRVNLMTIHNGKGLEFQIAFLAGMEEDLFPHANSRDNPAALEEERRLCYVGMTRAKELLYMTSVRCRHIWGTVRDMRPSRFLREIPTEYVEIIREKRRTAWMR